MSGWDDAPRKAQLEAALVVATLKMKAEYDREHPDHGPDDCWAEVEAAWDALGYVPRGHVGRVGQGSFYVLTDEQPAGRRIIGGSRGASAG